MPDTARRQVNMAAPAASGSRMLFRCFLADTYAISAGFRH